MDEEYVVARLRCLSLMHKDRFDYMVTPDCFEVNIKVAGFEGTKFTVERVYGSPGYEEVKGNTLCYMDSLFPSNKEDKVTTKGGVVLVKLQPQGEIVEGTKILLETTYKDRVRVHIAAIERRTDWPTGWQAVPRCGHPGHSCWGWPGSVWWLSSPQSHCAHPICELHGQLHT